MSELIIPDPQYRFLEPFKNRVFQYDTKHSNLFLAHYTNNILRSVGSDVIVRGLTVTAGINTYANGLFFMIDPGAVIQDNTYIELATQNMLTIEDIIPFSNQYVIIYTCWRYLQTVYENPFKLGITLYNKETRTTLTAWNSMTNRIILGIFKFEVEDGRIISVAPEKFDTSLIFADSNIVKNSTFDDIGTKYWTAINSILRTKPNDGYEDTPYLEIEPISDTFQGLGQVVDTKADFNYKLSFYIRAVDAIPYKVIIRNGDSIFDSAAVELKNLRGITTTEWVKIEVDFIAISPATTIIILKDDADLTKNFEVDHVFCMEYTSNRKESDVNKIKYIDGGVVTLASGTYQRYQYIWDVGPWQKCNTENKQVRLCMCKEYDGLTGETSYVSDLECILAGKAKPEHIKNCTWTYEWVVTDWSAGGERFVDCVETCSDGTVKVVADSYCTIAVGPKPPTKLGDGETVVGYSWEIGEWK